MQDDTVQRYLTEVAEVDAWYHELLRRYGHLPTGFIYKSQDLISDQAQNSSRFFADYLRPLEIGHNLGVMVGDGSSEDLPVLPMCLYRPAGAPSFTAEEDVRLKRLQTHFTRAMRVRNRMRAAAIGNAALALDKVATATVVLSRDRKILLANPAAETLFKQSDVPLVRAGRLCATEPANTTALEQSLMTCQMLPVRQPFLAIDTPEWLAGKRHCAASRTAAHCHPQRQPGCRHWLPHSGGATSA